MENVAINLGKLIEGSGILEVARSSYGADEVSFMCRTADMKKTQALFLLLVRIEDEHPGYVSHYCMRFTTKVDDKGERIAAVGWHIQYKSADLESAIPRIRKLWAQATEALKGMRPMAPEGVEDPTVPRAERVFFVDKLLEVDSRGFDARAGRVVHEANPPAPKE